MATDDNSGQISIRDPVLDLAREAAQWPWYHTIVLPGGVTTPGYYDTAGALSRVGFPSSLADKRCLDIGTADGFWAFEMERRGASEVVAIDLPNPREADWPGTGPPEDADLAGSATRAKACFEFAGRALGSSVQRLDLSVYDLSPERVGEFDFVFIGNLLIHLRDPVGALQAARSVVAGELFSVDVVSMLATIKSPVAPSALLSRQQAPWWWIPNLRAYHDYFVRAGYDVTERGGPFLFPFGKRSEAYRNRPAVRTLLTSPAQAWFWFLTRPLGATSAWVRARRAST